MSLWKGNSLKRTHRQTCDGKVNPAGAGAGAGQLAACQSAFLHANKGSKPTEDVRMGDMGKSVPAKKKKRDSFSYFYL